MPRQLISSAMDVNTSLDNFEAVIEAKPFILAATMGGKATGHARQPSATIRHSDGSTLGRRLTSSM
jgi:hypothetical protein